MTAATDWLADCDDDAPAYGENGAEVARAKALVMYVVRARSPREAKRRLERFRAEIGKKDWSEAAFLAVQECRDLAIISRFECLFLLDMIYRLRSGIDATVAAGARRRKARFLGARGESQAARMLAERPREYEWTRASGAVLLIEKRAYPEIWRDEEPSTSAAAAIAARIEAVTSSATNGERKAAHHALDMELLTHREISDVFGLQQARAAGLITFEQSAALLHRSLKGLITRMAAVDRECWLLRIEGAADGAAAARRIERLMATVFRRVGEHRIASLLTKHPGAFTRMVENAWEPESAQRVVPMDDRVCDVPVVARLRSRAVRNAKNRILQLLDARSSAMARHHLRRLTDGAASWDRGVATATITAIQELHDLGTLSTAETYFMLALVAAMRELDEASGDNEIDDRTRVAERLRAAGEPDIADRVTEGSRLYEMVCVLGHGTLSECRPTPDGHLQGVPEPGAVARISELLAAWAAAEPRSESGPEWEAFMSEAEAHALPSGIRAVKNMVSAGVLSDMQGFSATMELLDARIDAALRADRYVMRLRYAVHIDAAAAEAGTPIDQVELSPSEDEFLDHIERRSGRVDAVAYRRFGEHVAANMRIED